MGYLGKLNRQLGRVKHLGLTLSGLALLMIVGVMTACSSSESSQSAQRGTGSMLIYLRQADGKGATAAKSYISKLVLRFYEGVDDETSGEQSESSSETLLQKSAGELLFTREVSLSEDQESVLIEEIPAPQNYFIAADMYMSGSESVYRTAHFWATVLVGQTASTEAIGADVKTLALSEESVSVAVGETVSLALTATYQDGFIEDVTEYAAWSTTDASIATVEAGLVTGVSDGSCEIIAEYGSQELKALATVTSSPGPTPTPTPTPVALSSIVISSSEETIHVDDTVELQAKAVYVDGTEADVTSEVTWASDDETVATVTESGIVTGIKEGTAHITASLEDELSGLVVSEPTAITVNPSSDLSSIYISSEKDTVRVDETLELKATAVYEDGSETDVTSEVTWESDNEEIAVVTSGLLTGLAEGTVNITASLEDDVAGLVVSEPMPITV
ncbi:Ig-like domain-containing protein, partial [bacterium]|nr:Ig-like domain-containing protein [bacterium]